jgi:hypothetical protein
MELFLNLCWLSLLLPAYLLWRQCIFSASSGRPSRNTLTSRLVFLCALGCAFVLLFPVISATDDLHAMRPEMEESERAGRDAKCCSSSSHALAHLSQPAVVSAVSLSPEFAQVGTVPQFAPPIHGVFAAPAPAGRGPPLDRLASL